MGGDGRKRYVWAGAGIFFGALLIRAAADLIFFARHGWFSSHLIEVWFYYGVARGVFSLSPLDPTFLLLRLPGLLLPEAILYQATVFAAAVVSALTAYLIYGWLRRRRGEAAGIFGGLAFALLPAPITLCLVNFSHDLVAIPLIVLFFRAAAAAGPGGEGRGRALAAALIFFFLGLMVGPLMAGAGLAVIFYALWPFLNRLLGRPPSSWWSVAFLLGLIGLSTGMYLVIKPNLLNWIAPLALRFRGIDLSAQMLIQVGDLQPLPPEAFWNRYTLLVFLLPWGFWTAFRRRDFFALTLFLVSLSLALVVNRAARLLDISVVLLAALALSGWKKPAGWVTAAWALLLFLGNFFFPSAARAVYAAIPLGLRGLMGEVWSGIFSAGSGPDPARLRFALIFIGYFVLGLAAPLFPGGRKWWGAVVILPLAVFLQIAWVLEVAGTSSEEMEYRAYRWLDEQAPPGEKIFAAWNQGYFIGSVTDLTPITTPERIDLSLSRLYWEEEDYAVRELLRREVSYVHVSSRYFGITGVNREADTFGMRGSTIIGPRPDHIRRFSRMRRTLLFRMLYEPESLSRLEPVYEDIDPRTRLLVRIFQLVPSPEP
jgi:hypothetical protein